MIYLNKTEARRTKARPKRNMSDKICYIIGAGECAPLNFIPLTNDIVIAADGGLEYLKSANIAPDLIIGDFDSLSYAPQGERVIRLKPEKDDTDAYHAARLALEKGYRHFYIYGGTGGRLAHTLSNIQLLEHIAEQGGRGYLMGKNEILTVLRNGNLEFLPEAAGYISIFAVNGTARSVTLSGLKYPLNNYTMTCSYPIGTSNEFTGRAARVEVKSGSLLIVFHSESISLPIVKPFD